MATRNQVLSLFGATPQQIQEQERLRQAEFLASQRDPYQSAGAAIGVGLGRLFGGESDEVAQARRMQEAVQGVDTNDPNALRELAKGVAGFAPQQALQISAYASELEKSQRPDVEYRQVITGYYDEPVLNPLTGMPTGQVERKPIKDTAIIKNGEITGYTSGRGMTTGGDAVPGITDTPEAQAARQQPANLNRRWNPETGKMETIQESAQQSEESRVTENVPLETQERIMQQAGPRGGTEGALNRIPPPASVEGEMTYLNPDEAKMISDQLRDEITALEKSNDPQKKEKIAALKKRRAEVQKLRISSRRQDQSRSNRSRRGK